MAVTVARIAEAAKVSPSVVSKVLNDSCGTVRVADATRNRVLACAERMGYRRNGYARSIRTGRFNSVALLLGGQERRPGLGWLPGALLAGIQRELAATDTLLQVDLPDDALLTDETRMPLMLREHCCDGLLVNYIVEMPDRLIEVIQRVRIPTVLTNAKLPSDCVYPDDVAAGRMAVEHLYALGHRRIGYLGWNTAETGGHYSEADRLQGYRDAMRDHGLSPRVHLDAHPDFRADAFGCPNEWLQALDRPTAVVAYKEQDALRLLLGSRGVGVTVPASLSIVTFCEEPSANASERLPVTAIQQPFVEVGRRAVRLLRRKIDDPLVAIPGEAVVPSLLEGQTCAPPAQQPQTRRRP